MLLCSGSLQSGDFVNHAGPEGLQQWSVIAHMHHVCESHRLKLSDERSQGDQRQTWAVGLKGQKHSQAEV